MKNIFKRAVGLVLSASVLSISAFAAFVDMPEDVTEKAVLEKAVENGLLNGVGNDMIAPYDTITRAQMGAILVRAMGATKKADISRFTDVAKDKWYYAEMASAVYMGAFQGDGASSLTPEKEITYQEAFLVLSRVFDLRYVKEGCLDGYSDNGAVASWAKDGVEKIVSGGYYGGESLNPTMPISRIEFAKLMDKLVAVYIDEPGTYKDITGGNVLVRCDGVVLDGIKGNAVNSSSEGDLVIIGDKVKECQVINTKGANLVVRGGNVKLSGEFGVVRAITGDVILTPDQNNISVTKYPDGTRGVIAAVADGSYINLESTLAQ